MSNILCIYHAFCADGFGAAWAVHHALGDEVEFYAASYQQDPPDVTGKHVIIVDFSYKKAVLEEMAEKAQSVLVLDHHKSAAEDLQGLLAPVAGGWLPHKNWFSPPVVLGGPVAIFDMARSGAMMAWDYFHPGKKPPRLIEHIQDRDLWKFEFPQTEAINAALFSFDFSFDFWDLLMLDAGRCQDLFEQGKAIIRDGDKKIQSMIDAAAYRVVLNGHDVRCLNVPFFMASKAGHILAEGEAFSVTYYDNERGRKFSLRSTNEGLDVSEIAKQYGGGGHRNAAGFEVPPSHFLAGRLRP